MAEPTLDPCGDPGYIKDLNVDQPPPYCSQEELDCNDQIVQKTQKDVAGRELSWLEEIINREKTKLGQSANCDPMLAGRITNPPDINHTTLYKYDKALRGADEAMLDLFSGIVVIDENNREHEVPIKHATQEKAVAMILYDNIRKDDSLVVDRVRLPMLAIHQSGISFNENKYIYHRAIDYLRDLRGKPSFTIPEKGVERSTVFGVARGLPVNVEYTMWAWTMYREDMNQIVEQILPKIMPMGYIRVRGVSWEIPVKLQSVGNNITTDPGDKKYDIYKYQFTMTAETFIPQPLVRKRAVLKVRAEVVNALRDEDITQVIERLEEAVKRF